MTWINDIQQSMYTALSYPGSNPSAFSVGAAAGPLRYPMNALAASGDLLSAPTPAAKMVTDAISPGNGPTSCAPLTGTISDPCATPSSASPLATTSAAWAPGTNMVFALSCSVNPR